MRFNEREAAEVLNGTIDLEGRLNFRKLCPGSYSQPGIIWFSLYLVICTLSYFRLHATLLMDLLDFIDRFQRAVVQTKRKPSFLLPHK